MKPKCDELVARLENENIREVAQSCECQRVKMRPRRREPQAIRLTKDMYPIMRKPICEVIIAMGRGRMAQNALPFVTVQTFPTFSDFSIVRQVR